MEYFTWNVDINFIRVIKTPIQGSVYGYSGSYAKEIYDGAKIPATPKKAKAVEISSAYFTWTLASRWEYYNSNQVFHSLYEHTKSLCGILPPGLAHPLYCPRTFTWCFRVLALVEWSCLHSIMSFLTFLKRALFSASLSAS